MLVIGPSEEWRSGYGRQRMTGFSCLFQFLSF
jgi:hypothetical protein